jgi:hypothetical protein
MTLAGLESAKPPGGTSEIINGNPLSDVNEG